MAKGGSTAEERAGAVNSVIITLEEILADPRVQALPESARGYSLMVGLEMTPRGLRYLLEELREAKLERAKRELKAST